MATSRLKFELIEEGGQHKFENSAPKHELRIGQSKRIPEQLQEKMPLSRPGPSQLGDGVDSPRWADSLRSSIIPSTLDPGLMEDLAAGLEFLHHQLDDSEAKLQQSREQSVAFGQDAIRWHTEAARTRAEAATMREMLDGMRTDFEVWQRSVASHEQMMASISSEMAEIRSAHRHLAEVAGEQQRALAFSLELVRRANPEAAASKAGIANASAGAEVAHSSLLAPETEGQSARLDLENAAAVEISALRTRIATSEAAIDSLQVSLADALAKGAAAQTEAERLQSELDDSRLELTRLSAKTGEEANIGLAHRLKEVEYERLEGIRKLQEAEAEIALQNAEIESHGAIIIAFEHALEEQTASLRTHEERFLAYAERVQSLQIERLEMPRSTGQSLARRVGQLFSPAKRKRRNDD